MHDGKSSQARKSDRLKEEDAFMELHGGKGARLIYWTVCQIEAAGNAVWCLLRGRRTVNNARQRQDCGPVSNCGTQAMSSSAAAPVVPLRTRP